MNHPDAKEIGQDLAEVLQGRKTPVEFVDTWARNLGLGSYEKNPDFIQEYIRSEFLEKSKANNEGVYLLYTGLYANHRLTAFIQQQVLKHHPEVFLRVAGERVCDCHDTSDVRTAAKRGLTIVPAWCSFVTRVVARKEWGAHIEEGIRFFLDRGMRMMDDLEDTLRQSIEHDALGRAVYVRVLDYIDEYTLSRSVNKLNLSPHAV
jgi:hypothetical protein